MKTVLKIVESDSMNVCDISIKESHHSFLANGISVHNCFRWANSEPMEKDDFFHSYGIKTITDFPLINNYRSTANIVRLFNITATKYDSHAPSIPTQPDSAGSVKLLRFDENTHEGHFIAKTINDLVRSGTPPSKITVLARRSSFLRQIVEPSLVEKNIPYILSTPLYKIKFFEIPVNALFFAILDYVSSSDPIKIANVSSCLKGIGKTGEDRIIEEFLSKNSSSNKIFTSYLNIIDEHIDYTGNLVSLSDQILRVIPLIIKEDEWNDKKLASTHKTFISFIKHMEYENKTNNDEVIQDILDSIYDYHAQTSDSVILTTIHQYKGLENDIVFVGDLTYIGSIDNSDSSIFPVTYVALSRAKKQLYVTYSDSLIDRKLGKIKTKLYPSFAYTLNKLKGN